MRSLRRTTPPPSTTPERELAYAIAQAVYDLRTEQGLSQGQLAERIGTKQPRISVMESASGLPSLPLLLRTAHALGVRLTVRFEHDPQGTEGTPE